MRCIGETDSTEGNYYLRYKRKLTLRPKGIGAAGPCSPSAFRIFCWDWLNEMILVYEWTMCKNIHDLCMIIYYLFSTLPLYHEAINDYCAFPRLDWLLNKVRTNRLSSIILNTLSVFVLVSLCCDLLQFTF